MADIFDDTTQEKLDYDESMKIVDEGKGCVMEGNGKKYLHVYTDAENKFFKTGREKQKKKDLEPMASELSDSAVEIAEMATDNEDAIVELGSLISELTARVKALEEAQNG